jgi:hypothetical protein
MKFSIRDLLLATFIVALMLAWSVNRGQLVTRCEKAEHQRDDAIVDAGIWKYRATSLAETMQNAGWKVGFDDQVISLISPPEVLPDSSAPASNPPKP